MAADGLRLTILGCSGSYPGPGGACSGYLLQAGDTTVWMDGGSGTLANLQRHVGLDQIDAVVVSHGHPDHWSDLEGFFVASAYVLGLSGIPVYAPKGIKDLMRMGDTSKAFAWQDIRADDRVTVGSMTFTFSRTDHPVETLAARLDANGRSLGYSADSGSGWSIEKLGPDLDLALCEATFLQDREDSLQHLSARQAGTMAREAGADRLMITHLWPTVSADAAVAEASAAFGRPVLLARLNESHDV
jgi:ribonuclease BN (tRNA processing enzyme)